MTEPHNAHPDALAELKARWSDVAEVFGDLHDSAVMAKAWKGQAPVTSFRDATTQDVEAVVALVESAYRGDASRSGWTTEADLLGGQRTDADDVRDALPHLVLAVRDGELLGCCVVRPAGSGAYFGTFAVRPGGQSRGTGSALLAEAERRAREWGADRVEMTVLAQRADLQAWYERRGYVRTGEQRPFPYGDERFGVPCTPDLVFDVLIKGLC